MPGKAPVAPLTKENIMTEKDVLAGIKRVSDAIYNDLEADSLIPTEAAAAVVEDFKPNEVLYQDREDFVKYVKDELYDDILFHNSKSAKATTAVAKKRAKNEETWFKGDTTVRARAVAQQLVKSAAKRLVLLDDHGRLTYSILADLKSRNRELFDNLEIVAVSVDESCQQWQENFLPKPNLETKLMDIFSEEFTELLKEYEGNETLFYFSLGSLDDEGRMKLATLLQSEEFEKASCHENDSVLVFLTLSVKGAVPTTDPSDIRKFIHSLRVAPLPLWHPKLFFDSDYVPADDKVIDYIRHGEGKTIVTFAGAPVEEKK
ncbi:hypothetical protein ADEAN_000428900 [Angomonas deanei]|uniref:Uncharacterized protein n=1 Tax=Angomonas deanei TaxID=59799 RepID=A0A7G2CCS4_9TRYP|nr:hypothetical protein ADEAN_000428900 [Angomonas deanei]